MTINLKDAFFDRDDESPLLEELGIDLLSIRRESSLALSFLSRDDYSFVKNADISGPLLFLGLYAIGLALNCKIHFGYVYFISLLSIFSMYSILNLVDSKNIGMGECVTVMGYSMVPMVIFSFANIFLSFIFRSVSIHCLVIGVGCAMWSTVIASSTFLRYMDMRNRRIVVAYPIMMCYVCLAMIVIF